MFLGVGQNHLAHGVDAVAFEEHVLGAAESDAVRAEGNCVGGLFGGVGVGADAHAGGFGAPVHELLEILVGLALPWRQRFFDEHLDDFRGGGGNLAGIDFARGAVDGECVAFLIGVAVDGHGFGGVVDLQCGGAANADLAHLAGNEGRVRADTAFRGENAFGGDHAAEIFGRGFVADEEDFLALLGGLHGAIRVEVHAAGGGAGTGGQTFGDYLGGGHGFAIEDGRQDLIELIGWDAADGGLPVDQFFFFHFDGETDGG